MGMLASCCHVLVVWVGVSCACMCVLPCCGVVGVGAFGVGHF